jgi:hypothetical protein
MSSVIICPLSSPISYSIGATMAVLIGSFSGVFLLLLPIQVAAFGMTLVKKSLISNVTWHALYTASLIYVLARNTAFLFTPENSSCGGVLGLPMQPMRIAEIFMFWAFLAVARFWLKVNKYLLWTAMAVALQCSTHKQQ